MSGRRLPVKRQRLKYVACDYVTANIAFFLFNVCRFYLLHEAGFIQDFLLSSKLIAEQVTIPFGMLGIYWLSGYYNLPFGKSRLQELVTTIFSALINTVIIYLLLLINDSTGERSLNYELIGSLAGWLFTITYIGRASVTSAAIRRFRKHTLEYRTLIVGNNAMARATGRRLKNGNVRMIVNVVGYLALPGEEYEDEGECVYRLEDVDEVCRAEQIDQLVISGSFRDDKRILDLLFKLFHLDIPIKIEPDTFSYVTSGIRLQDIYGEPFVDLTTPTLTESAKNVKRMLDVTVSAMALIFLSPVYLLLAVMVKMDSKGPVFYSQERIGRRQRPFRIYKFRTMRTDAEAGGPRLSKKGDPRVTETGKLLRKYRLDELPQFWNVLKGEMSIVGPRPERRYFIEQIMKKAPYYALVYQVRPGITSWGMVKYGYASDVDQMVERTRYDLIYLSNMSINVDIKILIYTIRTVLTGRGM